MASSIPLIVNKDLKSIALHPIKLESRQFDENWLQELLFAHPELLPTNAIDSAYNNLIPLAREFPTTAGPIDVLYATPEGQLCVVETKLWRNPEAHRTVLAQILEYARHLANLGYSEFKAKVEACASRDGSPKDLLTTVADTFPKMEFDGIAFEDGLRQSLATGNFLLLIVGDRIRPEVAMLSEIIGTAPSLEFTLRLIEITFYHLDTGNDWPVLAVPAIVGQTREETRAVVRIRYEQKQPEVEVTAIKPIIEEMHGRTDLETFLASTPRDFAEELRPYIERWMAGPFVVAWGSRGFSLRYAPKDRLITIVDAFPTGFSVFMENRLKDWGDPIDEYQTYRAKVNVIPEVTQVYSQVRRTVFHERITPDDLRLILEATDELARALVARSRKQTP
jgi:hypothetical protein